MTRSREKKRDSGCFVRQQIYLYGTVRRRVWERGWINTTITKAFLLSFSISELMYSWKKFRIIHLPTFIWIFYLIDLMQIVRNIRNKQDDNICMSRHKSCFFSFFQVLIDSLDEWLYFWSRCCGFGSRRLLDLTILLRLLAFRIRQRWPKSSITGNNRF